MLCKKTSSSDRLICYSNDLVDIFIVLYLSTLFTNNELRIAKSHLTIYFVDSNPDYSIFFSGEKMYAQKQTVLYFNMRRNTTKKSV